VTRCFAHVINLAVQDALKALHDVNHLLQSMPLSIAMPPITSTFDDMGSHLVGSPAHCHMIIWPR
jgi:hypothetical protein